VFEYAALNVCDRQIQRRIGEMAPALTAWLKTHQSKGQSARMYICADGTGLPMRPEELTGRKGKQADGSAKTREAKLGCVLLQTEVDPEGHPIRKEDSTSYIRSFEPAAEFGLLLRQEAQRRGMTQATTIIFIGDGAAWIWELVRVNFPGAILILDFYHGLQHVYGLVDALWGKETPEGKKLIGFWKKRLFKDQASRSEIGYLENNLERMTYGTFRKAGYFIGSGVVEAGCKTVIGKSMKCSGMFWSEAGGQGMLDLWCAFLSNRLDAFCQARVAHHAAKNNSLALAA